MNPRKPRPADLDLTTAVWQKSSHSNGTGNCVELAVVDGYILVRDSENPSEPPQVYTRAEVSALFAGIRDGEFDHLLRS